MKRNGRRWTGANQRWLDRNRNLLRDQIEEISGERIKIRIKRRIRLRKKVKLGSKAFWNLVKKVGKQLSQLNAVEDENGILVTDLKLIEEIVISELGKIFNGQNSDIFSFKGEQIIKAAYTSIHGSHSE